MELVPQDGTRFIIRDQNIKNQPFTLHVKEM